MKKDFFTFPVERTTISLLTSALCEAIEGMGLLRTRRGPPVGNISNIER